MIYNSIFVLHTLPFPSSRFRLGHRHLCKFHIYRGRYSRELQYNLKLWVRKLNISRIEPKYVLPYKKKLEDTNWRRTDNRTAKRKGTKGQTIIYNTLHKKLKIGQHETHKNQVWHVSLMIGQHETHKNQGWHVSLMIGQHETHKKPGVTCVTEDWATRNPQKNRGDMCHWWSGNPKPTKNQGWHVSLMAGQHETHKKPGVTCVTDDRATRNPQKTRGDMCHWWSGNTKPTKVRQLYKPTYGITVWDKHYFNYIIRQQWLVYYIT